MNELAERQQSTEIGQVHDQAGSLLNMIERLATDPNADVTKLEKMLDMQERVMDREASAQFNAAMCRAQSSMGRVSADAVNPQTRSTYASYAALDRALRPIYTKEGFSLSFDTGDGAPEGMVRVVCHVSHQAGHVRTYHADMPADGKGAKGNAVMTATHATGAAMSYGMRYLLKLIFNVAIGEEDNDGNGPEPDLSEVIRALESASSIEALQKVFTEAWKEHKDKASRQKLTDIKDIRKEELSQ